MPPQYATPKNCDHIHSFGLERALLIVAMSPSQVVPNIAIEISEPGDTMIWREIHIISQKHKLCSEPIGCDGGKVQPKKSEICHL